MWIESIASEQNLSVCTGEERYTCRNGSMFNLRGKAVFNEDMTQRYILEEFAKTYGCHKLYVVNGLSCDVLDGSFEFDESNWAFI